MDNILHDHMNIIHGDSKGNKQTAIIFEQTSKIFSKCNNSIKIKKGGS